MEQQNSKYHSTLSALNLLLTGAIAVFVLSISAKVGFTIAAYLEPEPAIAAEPQQVAPVETPEIDVEATPVAPVWTPVPLPIILPPETPAAQPTPAPVENPITTPRLVVGDADINVRSGPGKRYEIIGSLEPNAAATITGRNSGWWQIIYEDKPGWVFGELVTATATEAIPLVMAPALIADEPRETVDLPAWAAAEGRWIEVDLSAQRLNAYEGITLIQSYLVSTGLPQTPTPTGEYRIYVKYVTDDMAGADYYIEDVPWVMYFYQGYGLHGVTWHANFGYPMSHGCVNQPNDMAEWLYDFAEVGTLVYIHD